MPLGGWCLTTVPVTKTIRLSEWVTPGGTAIPGMTSLKDEDLQHSSALAQSPEGDIDPNHPSEINSKPDSQYVEKRRSFPAVCAIPGRPVSDRDYNRLTIIARP